MNTINIKQLAIALLIASMFIMVGCEGDSHITNNNYYYTDTIVDPGGTGGGTYTPPDTTGDTTVYDTRYVVTFDSLLNDLPYYNLYTQHALISYKNIQWDNDGVAGGWGWGVYSTSNSQPYSGTNYVINRHGKNFLGFTFATTVNFEGAYFTKASRRSYVPASDPDAVSANKVRYHYYDDDLNLIGISDWFALELTPKFFEANVNAKRVVVEHDVDHPISAMFGVTDAEWFSMDNVMFGTITE